MLSLKALLFVSVSCLAHLAAASPLDHPGLEVRQEICVPGSKGGDKSTIGDLCTVSRSSPSPLSYPRLRSSDFPGYVLILIWTLPGDCRNATLTTVGRLLDNQIAVKIASWGCELWTQKRPSEGSTAWTATDRKCLVHLKQKGMLI